MISQNKWWRKRKPTNLTESDYHKAIQREYKKLKNKCPFCGKNHRNRKIGSSVVKVCQRIPIGYIGLVINGEWTLKKIKLPI